MPYRREITRRWVMGSKASMDPDPDRIDWTRPYPFQRLRPLSGPPAPTATLAAPCVNDWITPDEKDFAREGSGRGLSLYWLVPYYGHVALSNWASLLWMTNSGFNWTLTNNSNIECIFWRRFHDWMSISSDSNLSVVNREFSNERKRVEKQQKYLKQKKRKDFTTGFLNYFDWVGKAGSTSTSITFIRCFDWFRRRTSHSASYRNVSSLPLSPYPVFIIIHVFNWLI